VPFIRYTRDKRGYETTFVMHGYRPANGPQDTRVLYLFRSPSHIRFGRRPLDEESREALNHTHPELNFDWTVLGRESDAVRTDDRDRDRDRENARTRRSAPPARQRPAPAPAPMPIVVDDQSLLGRTLGGEAAIRYRARYSELLERIARRARTPEQRDRLTEAVQRLNPDDWPDEGTIRSRAPMVEREWDALTAELPARRRSRRGGRRRDGQENDGPESGNASGDETIAPGASDIMSGDGEVDDTQHTLDATAAGSARGDRADSGPDGAGTDGRTAGHDLPGDDKLRQD